jgi:hypothetical protein
MYVSLLRLYVEVSQQSPLLYIGLIVLLMASWGLVVLAIAEIAIRIFDVPDTDEKRATLQGRPNHSKHVTTRRTR